MSFSNNLKPFTQGNSTEINSCDWNIAVDGLNVWPWQFSTGVQAGWLGGPPRQILRLGSILPIQNHTSQIAKVLSILLGTPTERGWGAT